MTSEFGIRAAAELFAASPMGVSVITADGTERLFANQEFATLFGFSDLEEALQFPIESTFVDIDDLARARTSVPKQGETASHEFQRRRRDGSLWWCRLYVTRNQVDGRDCLVSWFEDITVRVEAERRAQDSEKWRRMILDNAADAVITTDEIGVIESANASAVQLFGYSENEFAGLNVDMLMDVPSPGVHARYVANYLKTGQSQIIGTGREVNGRRKTGEIFPLYIAVSEVAIAGKRWFSAFMHDLTAQKQVEERLRLQSHRAEAADLAKSQFLSNMSHELRTPLNAVLGFSQLLSMKVDDADDRDAVDHIQMAGQHLLSVVNDVLDLSRIDVGEFRVQRENVDLNDVLSEALELIKPLAVEHEVTLRLDFGNRFRVFTDRNRFRQVLVNILTNAVKYNRHRGSVEVTCRAETARWIAIEVADTGVGIPGEVGEEVFDPFFRIENEALRVEGTGLGLALTRQILNVLEGEIAHRPRLGGGTVFEIRLPVSEMNSVDDFSADTGEEFKRPHSLAQGIELPYRVVYVEDNRANAILMRSIFKRLKGSDLEIAPTAAEGLRIITEAPPDLILMDIRLPDMDGDEVIKELKSSPELRGIPVIAVTARAFTKDGQNAIDAGAVAVATKPLDIGPFVELMRKTLGL